LARIAGIDLPNHKRVEIALTYIYGIGRSRSLEIMAQAGIDRAAKVESLTDDDLTRVREILERDYMIEGDLRRLVTQNIKRLIEIGCYRGVRHKIGLPVRGQRTRTNARTRKGRKRTVAGKKKAPGKK
jgi:small subunit ribosomal protein S13